MWRARLRSARVVAAVAAWLALALVGLAPAMAQVFPVLSGRVVDPAGVIPVATRASIEAKLRDLEANSGIQLVAAVVPSLGGQEIEPYANQLFRAWQLGDRAKNNGALLLIATSERKIRIEVGYGLEGILTDALSKVIIANAIAPSLRAGDYGAGVARGVDDIITVLSDDKTEWAKRPYLNHNSISPLVLFIIIVATLSLALALLAILFSRRSGQRVGRSGGWSSSTDSGPAFSSSSSDSGGSSNDSFSGDGGSSGGGGASGDF